MHVTYLQESSSSMVATDGRQADGHAAAPGTRDESSEEEGSRRNRKRAVEVSTRPS